MPACCARSSSISSRSRGKSLRDLQCATCFASRMTASCADLAQMMEQLARTKKSERPERGQQGSTAFFKPACISSMKTDVPIDRRGALFPSEQSGNPKRRHPLRQEGRVLLAFRQAEIAPQTHPEGGKEPTNNIPLALRRRSWRRKRRIFVNLIPALWAKRAHIGRLNIPRPAPSARSDDSHPPAERSEHVPLRHLPARKQFRQIFFRK